MKNMTETDILLFIYNLLVWSHYCSFIKEFNNFIYLYMPIKNGTWQARVGIFYALKPFIKCKSKTFLTASSIFFSYVYFLFW